MVLAEFDVNTVLWVWIVCTFATALGIVGVVLLLFGITRSALIIDEHSDSIILAALRIRENTGALSGLQTTMAAGQDVMRTVKAVEADGAEILGMAAAGPGGGL
ncbi:MAG: hypothetical protein JWM18_2796 [Chloroflexi bacterium]|jgi:hypothetical protein|nr:hypothetical protein [Chloroflexota bacterium]